MPIIFSISLNIVLKNEKWNLAVFTELNLKQPSTCKLSAKAQLIFLGYRSKQKVLVAMKKCLIQDKDSSNISPTNLQLRAFSEDFKLLTVSRKETMFSTPPKSVLIIFRFIQFQFGEASVFLPTQPQLRLTTDTVQEEEEEERRR